MEKEEEEKEEDRFNIEICFLVCIFCSSSTRGNSVNLWTKPISKSYKGKELIYQSAPDIIKKLANGNTISIKSMKLTIAQNCTRSVWS